MEGVTLAPKNADTSTLKMWTWWIKCRLPPKPNVPEAWTWLNANAYAPTREDVVAMVREYYRDYDIVEVTVNEITPRHSAGYTSTPLSPNYINEKEIDSALGNVITNYYPTRYTPPTPVQLIDLDKHDGFQLVFCGHIPEKRGKNHKFYQVFPEEGK